MEERIFDIKLRKLGIVLTEKMKEQFDRGTSWVDSRTATYPVAMDHFAWFSRNSSSSRISLTIPINSEEISSVTLMSIGAHSLSFDLRILLLLLFI